MTLLNKIIISPPFGNWLEFDNTTRVLGTFTLKPRLGRLWRIIKTLRYNRRQQSWINQIGLRNPGIDSTSWQEACTSIVSIHGFNELEWYELVQIAKMKSDLIELNLSCPNVKHSFNIKEVARAIKLGLHYGNIIIAKLGPVKCLDYGRELFDLGVRYFHLCNTIPSPGGGISGKPLKQFSLAAIEDFRREWGSGVKIIGGGGISHIADITDYRIAGANYFAIGSTLFNPFNWKRIEKIIKHVNSLEVK